MVISILGRVALKNERDPIADSDFRKQKLVDAVVAAFNEGNFRGLVRFCPGSEDALYRAEDKYLGIFLKQPDGKRFGRFAETFLNLYSHYRDDIRQGLLVLEAQRDGSVRAKCRYLGVLVTIGD